jgi:hypothetical protein
MQQAQNSMPARRRPTAMTSCLLGRQSSAVMQAPLHLIDSVIRGCVTGPSANEATVRIRHRCTLLALLL